MARNFVSASTQFLTGTPLVTALPLTMGLRCRISQTTDYNCVMSLCVSGGSDRINLRVRGDFGGDPVEAVFIDIPNGIQGLTGSSYTSGEEMALVATASSGNKCKFYKNATLIGTTVAAWSPGSVNQVNIGRDFVSGGAYSHTDGDAWDAFLSNVEWTAADVAMYAAGYTPDQIRPDGWVHYWPLMGRASPEPDIFGGGTLTLGNTPIFVDHGRIIKPRRRRSSEFTSAAAATTTPKLIGGNLIRPNLVRGRLAA